MRSRPYPRCIAPRRLARLLSVAALLSGALVVAGPGTPVAGAASDAVVNLDRPDEYPTEGTYEGPGDRAKLHLFEDDLPDYAMVATVRFRSSSDPAGIAVRLRRLRNDNYFVGYAGFTTGLSNDVADQLRVRDGDAVTVAYLDPAAADGQRREFTKTGHWYNRTHAPDIREIDYGNSDPDRPVVHGGRGAVTPGVTVRAYPALGGPVLGSTVAGSDGSFDLAFPGPAPDVVALEAEAPGVPVSNRVNRHRAYAIGKLAAPEPGDPAIVAAVVSWYPVGTSSCPQPTDDCGPVGFTNHSGRFAVGGGNWQPGPHVLDSQEQGHAEGGVGADTKYASAGAYGPVSGVVVDLPPQPAPTVDLGVIRLRPPMLTGVATDQFGARIPGVEMWASDDRGEELSFMRLRATGGESGEYGMWLKDGHYRIEPRGPRGCDAMAVEPFDVTVTNGVASPAVHDLHFHSYGFVDPGPLATAVPAPVGGVPVQIDLGTPTGPASVTFNGLTGAGDLATSCRAAPVTLKGTVTVTPPLDIHASVPGFTDARVCLPYEPERARAAGVAERDLKLLHELSGGAVEELPSAVDPVTKQVCGTTRSFSAFAVGGAATSGGAPGGGSGASGYWMLGDDGAVYAFGVPHLGGANGRLGTIPAADLEPTPAGDGYWVVDDSGRVFPFGAAAPLGGLASGRLKAGERITGLSATTSGAGYWLFSSLGRVFPIGDAPFLGDMAGVRLNAPVLDSVRTASGKGYFMVAGDGGIFAFGDAHFLGSMGGRRLNAPVQSLVPDGDGDGYWLVASDGGIFAFGAPFKGSMGDRRLNRPVTGMVRFGDGYLMVGEDGGIFNFSTLPFLGSLGDRPPAHPIVAVAGRFN